MEAAPTAVDLAAEAAAPEPAGSRPSTEGLPTARGAPAPRHAARWWLAGWMAALATRALWVTLVHEPSRAVYSDMGGYFHRAGDVLAGHWHPYVFFQGAGYPLALAAVRRLWGNDADVGAVTAWIQIAASLAALAGTVQLARAVAGRRWAGAALALGAIHVPWIFFNSVYMAESLYTALVAAIALTLVAIARDPGARWRWTLLAGVLGGVAAWLKATHLLVGPVVAVLWIFPLRRSWAGAGRILAGWFLGLALALWIPHGLLSQRTTGRFMASPPAGGLNFLEGKCPSKENKDSEGYGYWSPLYVQKGLRNTRHWPRPFIDQGYFYAEGLRCIARDPAVLVRSFEALGYLFAGNELWPANDCGRRARWLSAAWARTFEWPLVAGVLLAFALALARLRRPAGAPEERAVVWIALAAPALSLFALVWITKAELRNRIPFDVFFLPLALWGIKGAAGWGRDRAIAWARARAGGRSPAAAAPGEAAL